MGATPPRLFRILLEVSDIASAVAFYSALLAIPGRPIFGGRHYFDCGEVIPGFVEVSSAGRRPQPTQFGNLLCFVDDATLMTERP